MKDFLESTHNDSSHPEISDSYVTHSTIKLIFGTMFTYNAEQIAALKIEAKKTNNNSLVKSLTERLKACGSKFINDLNYEIFQKKYLKLKNEKIPAHILGVEFPPRFIAGANSNRDKISSPKDYYVKYSVLTESGYIKESTSMDVMNQDCPNPPILINYLDDKCADNLITSFQQKKNQNFPFYECITSGNVEISTLQQSIDWWQEHTYKSYFNILVNGNWEKKDVIRLKKSLPINSELYLFGDLVFGSLNSPVQQEQKRVTVSLSSCLHLVLHESIELLLQDEIAKKYNVNEHPLKMVTHPRTFNLKTKKNVHGIGTLTNLRYLVAHSVLYFPQDYISASSEWELEKLSDMNNADNGSNRNKIVQGSGDNPNHLIEAGIS